MTSNELDRRQFLQLTAASYLALTGKLEAGDAGPAQVSMTGSAVRATGRDYEWTWDFETDHFRLLDRWGLEITSGKLQPAVLVQSESGGRRAVSGKALKPDMEGDTVRVRYEGVNGSGALAGSAGI